MKENSCNYVYLSVVIPLFNERENVLLLCEALHRVLDSIGKPYEIILIDDGSTDGTYEVLNSVYKQYDKIKIIRFRRNFGQTAAISAGFSFAKGEIIVTMDGDLQNDPADIPKILQKIDEGYDIVSGWRKNRKDPLLTRRLPSHIANFLISKFTGVKLHDYGCTLKAYRREIIKHVNLYGEMHRFIPAVASWMGATVTEIVVKHHPRKYGKSKYGISRTLKVILDLIAIKFFLSYLTRPIQIFGIWGILSIFLGIISGIVLILMKVLGGVDMTGNPLLILTTLLTIIGVLFIVLGLLGEITVRIYYEAQGKKPYVIKEILTKDSQSW